MHPCAFFSRRLNPAERGSPIGDRELLPLKLALEEWCHLLEGSAVPFLVWTDHQNLEYLRTGKLLNPRQARWSLFFSRFRFSLSYRPGSKNVKPDALSRLHSPSQSSDVPTTVLPAETLVAATHLNIKSLVERALEGVTAPFNSPARRLDVPEEVRNEAHSSQLACHPEVRRTLALLGRRFW